MGHLPGWRPWHEGVPHLCLGRFPADMGQGAEATRLPGIRKGMQKKRNEFIWRRIWPSNKSHELCCNMQMKWCRHACSDIVCLNIAEWLTESSGCYCYIAILYAGWEFLLVFAGNGLVFAEASNGKLGWKGYRDGAVKSIHAACELQWCSQSSSVIVQQLASISTSNTSIKALQSVQRSTLPLITMNFRCSQVKGSILLYIFKLSCRSYASMMFQWGQWTEKKIEVFESRVNAFQRRLQALESVSEADWHCQMNTDYEMHWTWHSSWDQVLMSVLAPQQAYVLAVKKLLHLKTCLLQ